jgi:hypothetical protein
MDNNNDLFELEINLLTKQSILNISRLADNKCSFNCDLDEIELKLLSNYTEDDFKQYKNKFRCLDNCLYKYFNSSLIGLTAIKNKINQI